jgi:hypothetical protein
MSTGRADREKLDIEIEIDSELDLLFWGYRVEKVTGNQSESVSFQNGLLPVFF